MRRRGRVGAGAALAAATGTLPAAIGTLPAARTGTDPRPHSPRHTYRRSTLRASQFPRNCTACTNTTMSSTAAQVMTGSNWR